VDELYDLNAVDAENLAGDRALHKEMVARMGAFLARDPRWIGYWHSFFIDHYFDLPRPTRDVQMFRPVYGTTSCGGVLIMRTWDLEGDHETSHFGFCVAPPGRQASLGAMVSNCLSGEVAVAGGDPAGISYR
jgi:hypothetical protein